MLKIFKMVFLEVTFDVVLSVEDHPQNTSCLPNWQMGNHIMIHPESYMKNKKGE